MKEHDSSDVLNILGVNKNSRIFIHIKGFTPLTLHPLRILTQLVWLSHYHDDIRWMYILIEKKKRKNIIKEGHKKIKDKNSLCKPWSLFVWWRK